MIASKLKSIIFEYMPNQWIIRSGPRSGRSIFLTFDDGPHKGYTNMLLDILRERNLKASFFVTGDHVKQNYHIFQDIIIDGHDVFNHSYNHWEFEKYDTKTQIKNIAKLDVLLPETRTRKLHAFRPPRGKLNLPLMIRLVFAGRQIIFWSYDSMDYKQQGIEHLLERFEMNPVKPGDIILFHDDNSYTIGALPILLDKWIAEGYEIRPVSKLSTH